MDMSQCRDAVMKRQLCRATQCTVLPTLWTRAIGQVTHTRFLARGISFKLNLPVAKRNFVISGLKIRTSDCKMFAPFQACCSNASNWQCYCLHKRQSEWANGRKGGFMSGF